MRHLVFTAVYVLSALAPLYGQSHANAAGRKGASSLIVPISATAEGALGTFWRTDLSIINHRGVEQQVRIAFNHADSFSSGPSNDTDVILPPNSTTTFVDVVATLFNEHGLGVIYINPDFYDPNIFTFDPAAELDVTYRSWTMVPGGKGTSSQSANALDMLALPTGQETRIAIGIRQDADFRCNVGITNIGYYDRTFRVTASSPAGSVTTTVTVHGFSVSQVPLPPADLGYASVTIEPLDIAHDPGGGLVAQRWTAYATSIDNTSGDSWLVNAVAQ